MLWKSIKCVRLCTSLLLPPLKTQFQCRFFDRLPKFFDGIDQLAKICSSTSSNSVLVIGSHYTIIVRSSLRSSDFCRLENLSLFIYNEPRMDSSVCPSKLEADITDIAITPDGRIRLFGLSRQVLELLCETGLADEQLQHHWKIILQHSDIQAVQT